MKKICLVLPFPPPFYGPSVYSNYFLKALESYKDIRVIKVNAELNNKASNIGKNYFGKLHVYIVLLVKVFFRSVNANLITNLHIRKSGTYKTFFILFFSKLFSRTTTLILHEGGLKDTLASTNFLHKLMLKYCVTSSDLILALDNIQKKEWLDSYKYANIEILPAYRENQENNTNKNDNIVFFSNLIPEKGTFEIIKIWDEYNKHSNIGKLIIMGSSVDKLVDKDLKKFENQYKNVEVLINVERNKALEIIKNSKIFVMPTYYFLEQQPAVLIEAMSFGLPIIGYNWRGLPFLIQDHTNGYIIDNNNHFEFSQKISTLLNNEELLNEFSLNSRNLFLKNHSLDAFTKKLSMISKKYFV